MINTEARIVFFGFSDVGYRCLKYLWDQGCNVVAVFTHDTDAHETEWFETPESFAKKEFIDVFKPTTLKTEKWFRKIKYMKPDLILSCYYRNFIPEEIFSQAKFGAYNMHGSYLPTYRGRAPLNWAVINGEDYTGVSLHVMEKSFDTGDIVFCYKDIQWPIPPIANRKRGFIGIRPFLRDIHYSTRGNYYFTNNHLWYFSVSTFTAGGSTRSGITPIPTQ